MCSASLSANVLSNPSFAKFVHEVRPLYKPPSREQFNRNLLNVEYEKMEFNVKNAVADAPFISLCSDGCSDVEETHVSENEMEADEEDIVYLN